MKYPDWQSRFWAEMDKQRSAPFIWGERDCVLFAAAMADAVSADGRYVARAREAFNWKNAREAASLLEAAGLQSLVETVLGSILPPPRLTMADIALVVDDLGRQSLAIHDGCGFIGPIDPGVQRIPFHNVKGGWPVT
jgi:hypothetical protein